MTSFVNYVQRNSSKENRWQLLARFVQDWRLPASESNSYDYDEIVQAEQRLGYPLPAALREWYLSSFPPYNLKQYVLTYDYLIPPGELREDGQYLPILIEYQDTFEWGLSTLDMDKDDPPVYGRDLPYGYDVLADPIRPVDPGNWKLQNGRLSEFITQMLVLHNLNRTGFEANAFISDLSVLEQIEAAFSRMGFPDWHHPPRQTIFYGAEDAILIVGIQTKLTISLVALSRPALENAMSALNTVQWDTIESEGKSKR